MFTAVCFIFAIDYHIGRHVWDIPLTDFKQLALLSWLAEFSFLVTAACIKISVLLFYRRLVKDTVDPRWKWAVIAAIGFTAAYSIAFMFMLIFNCNPTEAYWKSFDIMYSRNYTCVDTTVVNLLAGIFAVISDVYSVVLPCLMTRHFSLAAGQKLALNIIFSLGILVVAASAARTYYLYEVGHNPDVSPMIFNATAWSQLELQLAIVCASLPALRVFFRKYLSGPATQAFSFNRSAPSQQGSRAPFSEIHTGPDDFERGLSQSRQLKQSNETAVVAIEEEAVSTSPLSTAASTRHLVKSPTDYEEYNLQVLSKSRSRYSLTNKPDGLRREASHRLSRPVPDTLPP
ncbi:hypothetical protein LTR53_005553 [Teratosphaeriaceae sp. CCFEE 6253]|nr:hypothetical protein LTR53_005553 [Teratosphaeriaceae sp. CCFEE 6253]